MSPTHRHGRAIVLLEGVDKTGKSTEAARLERLLSEHGPTRVVHYGPPEGNPYEAYRREFLAAHRFGGSTIIDRMHWSNTAYQSVFRSGGAYKMTDAEHRELDWLLSAIGGGVVLKVRAAEEAAEELGDDDYKGRYPADVVQTLQDSFLHSFHTRGIGLPGCLVPFGDETPEAFIRELAIQRSGAVGFDSLLDHDPKVGA